jgi:hypothetical protein
MLVGGTLGTFVAICVTGAIANVWTASQPPLDPELRALIGDRASA